MELSSILIVDDDAASLARLARLVAELLDPQPVRLRTAANLADARDLLQRESFALALVDMQLPDGTGTDLIAWMQQQATQAQAVIVSAFAEEEAIFAALRAGAVGYLLKDRDDIELRVALRSLQRGGAPIDPMIARRILAFVPAATPTAPAPAASVPLSERELGILGLVAQGYGNREIAELLSLSRLTIEAHTRNIYRKLAVGSRTAAVFEARVLGLLP
ncbi:DNA-binding response regulator [Stenotrophomonas sp. ATCM1_4]|uniref:Response regulator transcription factor n=1 Tax=Stenotrophomonas capsici TaxID=3110230 RepID=A0ABU5V723_9GAMM|nr:MULTISPECIES: response regulator transcription factor [unclassified Stenotrophomonas]MEA5668300.1 response regulator transcription factor [Stenotrophomonas sp. MH1]TDB29411.1 DNA-binding response regulator [Stenotrophomonas sp. ATCM1_4]